MQVIQSTQAAQPKFAARKRQSIADQARDARVKAEQAKQLLDQFEQLGDKIKNGKEDLRGAGKGVKWGTLAGLALVLVPGGIPAGIITLLGAGGAGALGGGYAGGKLSKAKRQRLLQKAQREAERAEAEATRLEAKANPPQKKLD